MSTLTLIRVSIDLSVDGGAPAPSRRLCRALLRRRPGIRPHLLRRPGPVRRRGAALGTAASGPARRGRGWGRGRLGLRARRRERAGWRGTRRRRRRRVGGGSADGVRLGCRGIAQAIRAAGRRRGVCRRGWRGSLRRGPRGLGRAAASEDRAGGFTAAHCRSAAVGNVIIIE